MQNPAGTITIQRLAEILASAGVDTGEKRLYAWLRAQGYLDRANAARMRWIEAGLFKVKEGYYDRGGVRWPYVRTFVTSKGIQHIKAKFNVKDSTEYVYSGLGPWDSI